MQAAFEFAPGFDVFGANRLLEKQRVVGRQSIAQLNRLRSLENLGVRVEGDLVVAAHGLAQLAEIFGRAAHHFAPAVAVDVDAVGAELEGCDPPFALQRVHLVARGFRIGRGVQAGVNLHAVAHIAAQQHVDRHAQRLGGNIPHAMVECRDRRQPQRAGRETRLLHQVVDQEGNAARVLSFEEGHQVVEQRQQRQVGAMVVTLAPAGDALVGVHGHDHAWAVLVA